MSLGRLLPLLALGLAFVLPACAAGDDDDTACVDDTTVEVEGRLTRVCWKLCGNTATAANPGKFITLIDDCSVGLTREC